MARRLRQEHKVLLETSENRGRYGIVKPALDGEDFTKNENALIL